MEKFYSNTLQCEVQQVQKRTARKLFDAGKTIYLLPCNLMFESVWTSPMPTDKSRLGWHQNFDSICNEFTYYNCDCERGYYIRFYVKSTDLN